VLTIDFDQVDDIYKASPRLWSTITSLENIQCEIENLKFELGQQFINLNNLGIDYLSQYSNIEIPKIIYIEFLNYINNYYINIIEFLSLDYNKISIMGQSVYKILFVDFINTTLPQICNVKKINDPSKLLQANVDEIKQLLLDHYNNILKQLNSLYQTSSNLDIQNGMLQNSFAIDIFNKNLDDFSEKFFFPIVLKYQDKIRENI
jgi:hypothetical protein